MEPRISSTTCNVRRSAPLALLAASGVAWGGALEFDNGLDARYTLTLGYGSAVRTEAPADALINGPVDAVTGLPTTANFDDGDRNFSKGELVNNRATALGELSLGWGSYGLVLRGDGFYDDPYHAGNDNDSPDTVNKSGAHDEFTSAAREYSGGRARLLDAYLYGDGSVGDMDLNVRAGRHVVAWGETLFFSGVAIAQGPVDATKTNLPAVEVKSILLPIEQVSLQLGVTEWLGLMAYYRLRYEPFELEPVGSFFSTVDLVGPGAEFIYGFRNPLAGTPGAPPVVNIPREPDVEPEADGQWGVGAKFQVTPETDVGVYALQYHDTLPVVELTLGNPELSPGVPAPFVAPVSYHITYFDDIRLGAVSFATRLGDVSLAGEGIYREGVNVLVNGAFGPTSTRGNVSQGFLSAIYLFIPPPWLVTNEIDVIAEAGYLGVNDVEPLDDGSDRLTNTREAWGLTGILNFHFRNVLPKWDLAAPLSFGWLPKGKPAMAGALGSLYGENDRRASLFLNFTYLQNLQLGLGYNAFIGRADLNSRPFQDRDYAAVNVKYSF
jgi:hypothetical protein